MKNLATLDYWNKTFKNHSPVLTDNDKIKLWMLEYLKFDETQSCIEIGCYPGKYLTIPGYFGVQLNGIDFIEDVFKLPIVFLENGYNVGVFLCEDFTKNTIDRKFDYVMSFGFIEHFDKWDIIINQHLKLVADNGYVILEAPNFKGLFQRIPRFVFDYSDLKRHNLNSMNMKKWLAILEENGFEIITAEYFGEYELWFDKNSNNKIVLFFRKVIVNLLNYLKKNLYPKIKNHESFSCYMGIIARKKAI